MMNAINKFLRYWNDPLHPPTEEDIADLKAMELLLVKIRALDFEYDLPDFYCIF